jgi:hypothetical protein
MAAKSGKTASGVAYRELKDDAEWLRGVRDLGWQSSKYGGVVKRGKCPVCDHPEGIDVFVPSLWLKDSLGSSELAREETTDLGSLECDAKDSTIFVVDAHTERAQISQVPTPRQKVIDHDYEMVLCSCTVNHPDTPKGKSGCGRWGYVRVPFYITSGNYGE